MVWVVRATAEPRSVLQPSWNDQRGAPSTGRIRTGSAALRAIAVPGGECETALTMTDGVPPETREEWRAWAQGEVGPGPAAVDRATDAVLAALIQGHTVEDSMEIGKAAALGPSAANARSEVATTGTAGAPVYVSDGSHLRGVVGSFRERNELMGNRYGSVWDFRVDHWDRQGRSIGAVPVEMRGIKYSGSIGDGDWVEIASSWSPGKLLRPRTVHNLSQNSMVSSTGGASPNPIVHAIGLVFRLAFLLMWFAIAGVIAVFVFHAISTQG
jgi:hypothetical protein